jgi:hypothetical protein
MCDRWTAEVLIVIVVFRLNTDFMMFDNFVRNNLLHHCTTYRATRLLKFLYTLPEA